MSCIKKDGSLAVCSQSVLKAIIIFQNPYQRHDVYVCPECFSIIDKKLNKVLGIYYQDIRWALGFGFLGKSNKKDCIKKKEDYTLIEQVLKKKS